VHLRFLCTARKVKSNQGRVGNASNLGQGIEVQGFLLAPKIQSAGWLVGKEDGIHYVDHAVGLEDIGDSNRDSIPFSSLRTKFFPSGHGAPLRLQMPINLGYKLAKYLTSFRVSSVLGVRRGYWEDLGYSWYGGV